MTEARELLSPLTPTRDRGRPVGAVHPLFAVAVIASCGLMLLATGTTARAEQGARYLVICPDEFVDELQPLVEWKTKKGMLAKIVTVSEVGDTNADTLQGFIRSLADTWDIPPEYVLIAGSPRYIRSCGDRNDCYFGNLEGDYTMEIPVGRMPAESANEMRVMVAKTLAYERHPDTTDTAWCLKGTTVVGEPNPPDRYHTADARYARQLWLEEGYTQAESLYNLQGHSTADLLRSINDGRAIVAYRGDGTGGWGYFLGLEPETWANGHQMLLAIAGTCGTVTLAPFEHMYGDRFVRAGSVSSLGGAIAYFGTTRSASSASMYRSACFRGFMDALYVENNCRLGDATLRGRWRVDSLYRITARYVEWNLLGDPELNVWTGVPRLIEVTHAGSLPSIPQVCSVAVSLDGAPVEGAVVCLWLDPSLYECAETGPDGRVRFEIAPTDTGPMQVTVTGRNLRPYEGVCRLHPPDMPLLEQTGVGIDDFRGNGDGIVNPGEGIHLSVILHNWGLQPAFGVRGLLRTDDQLVELVDSIAEFGDILPDSTVPGEPFELGFSEHCPDLHLTEAEVLVTDSEGDSWVFRTGIEVRAGRLRFVSVRVIDSMPGGNGNGRLGPNESGVVQVAIDNVGGGGLQHVIGRLEIGDFNVRTVDSLAWYGGAGPGDTLAGDRDRFWLTTGPQYGMFLPLRAALWLIGDGGTYRYDDSVSFQILNEEGRPDAPTGPDEYGYWCFEDVDTASGRAPGFDWLDLAPPGPGERIPVVSDSDEGVVTVALPFAFRHYGQVYDSISICSNGFLAMGPETYRAGRNGPIPDTSGPASLVAGFWDDLNPDEATGGYGTAYRFHDQAGHRWIVQYDDFAHFGYPVLREKFQVVLHDQQGRPTPTGDGEIECFYHRVWLNSGCTVGIEDASETMGLQFVCDGRQVSTAGRLRSGGALRFTTCRPLDESLPWLVLVGVSVSDSAFGDNDGRFEPGETLGIAVRVQNLGRSEAKQVNGILRAADREAAVIDSTWTPGDVPVGSEVGNAAAPFLVEVSEQPSDTIVELDLMLQGGGYRTVQRFALGLSTPPGLAGHRPTGYVTSLGPVYPVPMVGYGTVDYSLSQDSDVQISLYDVTGRRALLLIHGRAGPGRYRTGMNTAGLGQGVYFVRFEADDGSVRSRAVRKVMVVK